jgi:hypothetical protein
MRFATKTWRTSCGSAVVKSPSTMFSSVLANTLPFASHAKQVGVSVGKTMTIGPDMSVGASALTQESSFSASTGASVVTCFEGAASASYGSAGLLRFLTFLSPLKCSALGMVIASWLVGVRRWSCNRRRPRLARIGQVHSDGRHHTSLSTTLREHDKVTVLTT